MLDVYNVSTLAVEWIEMVVDGKATRVGFEVSTLAVEWIEISARRRVYQCLCVSTLAVEWIEISLALKSILA